MDENSNEISNPEESDQRENHTDAASKASNEASAEHILPGDEGEPPMPDAPGDIHEVDITTAEDQEELLVDFGKVPLSKDRSEFDDSLYPVSVADPSQISDETSKLLHRLHYDPYDEDEAELRFLHSKPTCFIILGKPGSGKTDLVKKLANEWKCQMVSACTVIQEAMDMETEEGLKVQELLLRGESVPEEMAAKMIEAKINSPEVTHHGYVLDGFPSMCEDYLSINNQLELIRNWKMKPDFIINLKMPDNDLVNRRLGQKVDPMTGEIYTKEVYDPDKPEPVQKDPEDEGDEDREDEEEEAEPEVEEEPVIPVLPPEVVKRLVKRPEDMEAFLPDDIQKYKSNMLRLLEDYMADHDQQYLLELDANKPSHILLRELMLQLDTFVLRPAAVPLRLQDAEDEELPEDMDTDELLRTFAPKQMVAPRFRWRRSRWLRNCPVALADGNIVTGKPEYAVSFLDKMYVMSNDLAMAKFLKNPRPFLLPPQPRPPCKLVVLGPQLSGKTTVAHLLALRYGATVLDLDVLVIPRYQEEWERKVEKARDDAAAAAIELLKTKLAEAAEKERRRLETATSDDGNADDVEAGEGEDDEVNEDGEKEDTEGDKDTEAEGDKEVAAPVEEQDAEAEEAAVSQEAEEGKAEDQDVEQEDADEEKKKEKKEKDTTVMGVEVKGMTPDEIMAIPVTTRHPVIVRIANDAAREAVQEPFPIADELYVEVLETSIRNAEKVELLKNPDGPRYGGWVLDNFPRNKEQWILCVEKNLLPDDVVILSDPSDNGDFLIRRWYDLNKDVIDKRIENRLAREEQDRKDKEEAERRRIEEERLAEEEAARRLREEEIEARMEAGETLSEAKGPEGVEGEEVPREEGEEEEEAEAEAEAEVEVEVEEADADKEKGDEATEGSAAMEEEEEEPEPQPPEVLDLPLPPEGEELTQQREARKTQDEDIMSCRGIITSGGGIEPIIVDICEKNDFGLWSSRVIEDMLKDVTTHIEQKYMYQAWELQGMDIDEEEEDVEAERNLEPEPENEEEEQEEEEDPNRSVKKPLGDTNHFCPVALKEHDILLPGNPEITAKHRERYYYCSSNEARDKFIADPPFYLPKGKPPKVPPPRILMLGPRGAGKSLHGRDLARKMGIFHIQFRERLQELVIAKTKKKIGAEYTEDDDEPGEKEEEEEEEEDEDEDDIGAITAPDGSKMEEGDSADSKATITSPGDVDPQSSTSGVNIPAEKEEEEEEEVTYTEDEEAIVAYLKEDDPLPNELLEKIIADWWKKEPFKSTGFILEGYPRTADEASFLGEMGLFPDVALVLVVEDGDVIGRILPPRLDKWKRKRDKKLARKQRLKEKAAKKREAAMAKRRAALVKEQEERKAERKAELLAERGEEEGDSEEEAEEEEEEEEGDDIDAILAEEFEEEEEEEDGDEETEEEAVERMKNDIEEIYDTDTNRVAAIQEKLEEMLVPRIEVDAGKKTHIVRYIINRQLGPYLNNRDSIFERVIPISEPLANKMIRRGYKQPSRFGRWCPVKLLEGDCIQPMQGPGYPTFPAIYRQFIYYLSTAEALKQFSIDPLRYLKQPSPKPVVPIRMAIVGPPKSGKTSLAKRFENEYGVVRLSIGEAIRNIIELQPKTELVKTIKSFLRRGQTIPDELAVRALEVRLMDVTCQTRGYVLDGFPLTMKHVDLMTARDIIPVKMIELIVNSLEVVNRATKDRYSPERQMALHDSGQILMVKLATWQREINTVREHYADHHANWVKVDGQKCKWWVCNEVLKIGRESIVQIQKYLERLAEGKAASIADMCITPKEFVQRLGDFDQYCPVSLALKGELVDCSGIVSLKHAAEYRGHYYKMHGPEELKKFLADPNQFVPPNAPHTLPAPELLPKRVTGAEARRMFPKPIELKGYCPVTFLDGKKRYEAIVPGNQELVILYRGQLYNMATEKKLERFMRTPQKYWNLSLPHKLPPKKDPLTVTSLPMLGYLEQTVSTAITKALTAVGNVKPKYPFMNATQSALVYVAYHLKAYNPHSPEYVRKKYKLKLMQFEEMCEIINYLGLNMSKRYKEPKERPIDFDHKMDRFLQQKRRQSTQ